MAFPLRLNQRGFTLLELLIVVVVLGILVNIVVRNLSDSNQRAKIAAGKQLDGNIQRARGDQMIGNWLFDECTGTSTADSSGSNVTGTLNGAITWDSNTPYGKGCSLLFPGGSAYNRIESTAASIYAIQAGEVRTFTVWFKKSGTLSTDQQIIYKNGGCIGWFLQMNTTGAIGGRFTTPGCGSTVTYQVNSPGRYNDGNWHMAALEIDRSNGQMTLFVDGDQVASGSVDATNTGTGGSFNVGNTWNFTQGFEGYIDEVRIYKTNLEQAKIYQLHAEGKLRRMALLN